MKKKSTPIRNALVEDSVLLPKVVEGLGALVAAHRDCFDNAIRNTFGDSLDLDAALKLGREQENRWDYLLGHTSSREIVAVEPHSAKQDQITTVINKRAAARAQLEGHLKEGVHIAKWLWVASGKVHFARTERVQRQLDQHGIEFVTKVAEKHMPKPKKK